MKQQSPFKFLDAYQQADKAVFFGREKEADKLYEALSGVKHLLVFGPSGAGKTSLIECGLRNQFSDADWFALSIRRGNNMNTAVYARINEALEEKIAINPKTQLPENENTQFGEAIEQLFEEHFQPVYLLFDQFEELLILGKDAEKTAFFKNLNELIRYKIPCRILLIMREEFIGHLSEYEHLCPSIFKHRFRLEKMRKEKVGKVIEQMLEAPSYQNFYKLDNSQTLAKAILKNLPDEKREIELTHVQVFLSELWDRAKKKTATNESPVLKPALVEDTDNLEGVLNSFLKKQLTELNTKYKEDDALEVLDSMISERHTKLQLGEQAIALDLQKKNKAIELPALLQQLELKRLIRAQKAGEQRQYELSHDLLAKAVGENRTLEMKMRQDAEKVFAVYDKKEKLNEGDLNELAKYKDYDYYYPDGLSDKIEIAKKNLKERNKEEIIEARKRNRILASLLVASIIALIFAGWQFTEANNSKLIAEAETKKAFEAQEEAENKTKQALNSDILAQAEKQKALEAKNIAERKTREALNSDNLAQVEKQKALKAKSTAEQSDSIAQVEKQKAIDARKLAETQKKLAEQNLIEVEKQKEFVEIARDKTDSALAVIKKEQTKNEKIIDAFYFYKDKFTLAYKNNKFGFINKEGEVVIDYKYSSAKQFSNNGYAEVKKEYTSYLIDTIGEEFKVAYKLENLTPTIEALYLKKEKMQELPTKVFNHTQLKILIVENSENLTDLDMEKLKNNIPNCKIVLNESFERTRYRFNKCPPYCD